MKNYIIIFTILISKASKYWQCVREELVFFNQLLDHSIDYERNRLEKKKLQLIPLLMIRQPNLK